MLERVRRRDHLFVLEQFAHQIGGGQVFPGLDFPNEMQHLAADLIVEYQLWQAEGQHEIQHAGPGHRVDPGHRREQRAAEGLRTRLRVENVLIGSVTNIGTRPTFDERVRIVETHALNFGQDLYGRRVGLQFLERVRREMKFPSPETLVEQIKRDIARAREVLAAAASDPPRS